MNIYYGAAAEKRITALMKETNDVLADYARLSASHQRLKEALETCVAAIERTHHVDAAGRLAAADKAREALRSTP